MSSKIVSKGEIVPNVYELVVEAPEVASKVKPGQFGVVIPDEKGERIPMSLADWNSDDGTVSMYFLEVGVSTMKLTEKKAGEHVGFLAPLGKPATIDNFGTVLLGGGCYGIAAIYPIVRAMKKAGNKVITVIEARSDYLLYEQEKLKNFSDEFFEVTTDASKGIHGKVKDVLSRIVAKGEQIDQAYFMGCTFMMMLSSREAKEKGINSFVYLNPLMVDATGMCGVCRVRVGGETKFACVDGPEFKGEQVDWEELFHRKSQYALQERESYQYVHRCRLENRKGDE